MTVQILQGDCRDVLATLPDNSVHCVVTSPPYFGLRSYLPDGHPDKGKEIGLEPTLDAFVAEMAAVFREVRRVLRDDGTAWLNLGDSYCSSPPGNKTLGVSGSSGLHGVNGSSGKYRETLAAGHATKRDTSKIDGLKPKDLMMVPARVALALQADGWWLRSDIIWAKPNPMPESCNDRPTSSHEHLFLLTKSARYFYDADAIREECELGPSDLKKMAQGLDRIGGKHKTLDDPLSKASSATAIGRKRSVGDGSGRNKRNVWTIATAPCAEAHFATFPPTLVEPCILAGTSAHGCCAACGAPWQRVLGEAVETGGRGSGNGFARPERVSVGGRGDETPWRPKARATTGWTPTCECSGAAAVTPCTVLDPFGGAGTTGLVADRLGRNAILIELNPAYADIARNRIIADAPLFGSVA